MIKERIEVMKNKTFHFLWIGQSFANFGDVFYIVSVVSCLYHLTSKAMAAALVPFFVTLSLFISGIVAPIFFEKYKLKTLLSYGQMCKTFLLLFLSLFLHWGAEHYTAIVYVFVSLIAFLDGINNPIKNSLVPFIVSKEEILKANSFVNTLDQFIKLSAWPIGSLIVSVGSPFLLINITLLFYVVSSILMFLLHIQEHTKKKTAQGKGLKNFLLSIRLGWEYTWRNVHAKSISFMSFFEGIGNGVWISAILYMYVKEQLHVGEEWWGYINSVFFGGMVIGGLLSVKFSQSVEKNQQFFVLFGPFCIAIVTLLFGTTTHGALALMYSTLYGIIEQWKVICLQTILQKNARMDALPHVFSVQGVISSVTFGISTLLMSFIADVYGIRFSFYLSVCCFLISGWISYRQRKIWSYKENQKGEITGTIL